MNCNFIISTVRRHGGHNAFKSIVSPSLKQQAGVAAIEFALVAPLLLLLLAGVVEIGLASYEVMLVGDSAEAGALYAAKYGWNSSGIAASVVNATGFTGITATPSPQFFCGCPGSGGIAAIGCTSTCAGGVLPGQYVQISASINHQAIISYPALGVPAQFTRQSIIRIQ